MADSKSKQKKDRERERADASFLKRTLFLLILLGVVAFIPLAVKLYDIMIVNHEKYESMAVRQQTRESVVEAERGSIYDRNMNVLATSATVYNVFISPLEMKETEMDAEYIAQGLSDILGVGKQEIMELTERVNRQYEVVSKRVDTEIADKIRAFIEGDEETNDDDLRGVYLESAASRYYPYSSLAAQVLGFTGSEGYGLYGIESKYDDVLEGTDGYIVTLTDADGREMLFKYSNYYDAVDGDSLVLTMDATIQYYLEKHLEKAIGDYSVQNGAMGVIMNVNTGEVLAMATLEKFDLNNYQEIGDENKAAYLEGLKEAGDESYSAELSEAQLEQWSNRVVSDTYEPGSTFKTITMSMILEEGLFGLDYTYFDSGSTGSMYISGRENPITCWRKGGHGLQTLSETLANSCNPAFALYGLTLGAEKFCNYLEAYGFYDTTGLDMPGESGSIFWSDDVLFGPYGGASLAVGAFGQTFKITPIQLATAYCAVVNGGYLLKPYVVSEVRDSEGNVVEKYEKTVVRQVISEETSAAMRDMLELVVAKGSGKNAQVSGYRIGGKTGTSEKMDVFDENGQLVDDKIVSFCGVAPIDDPEIVCLVILDTPTVGYISGGVMAAPVAGSILGDVLPYLGIEPNYTEEQLAAMDETMPNVVGKPLEEAVSALGDSLDYRTVGSGDTVTAQLPAAGSEIAQGSYVILYLGGEADETELVEVPSMVGFGASWCLSNLNYLGLYMDTSGVIATGSGTVVATRQSVDAGTMVPKGTVITVQFADTNVGDDG